MSTKKKFSSGLDQMIENAEKAVMATSTQGNHKEPEVTINFKLPQSLHIALKVHVAQNGTSIKELVTKLLKEQLQMI